MFMPSVEYKYSAVNKKCLVSDILVPKINVGTSLSDFGRYKKIHNTFSSVVYSIQIQLFPRSWLVGVILAQY